jgi:hypothetical protein
MPKKKLSGEAAEADETLAAPSAEEAEGQTDSEQAPVPQAAPAPKADVLLDKTHVPKGGKAEAMRLKLMSEPKVRVLIPLADGEKAGTTQSVILNGYSMYIRKGDYIDVPESVAKVLEIKMKHKMAIEKHPLRASGTGEVKMDVYGD